MNWASVARRGLPNPSLTLVAADLIVALLAFHLAVQVRLDLYSGVEDLTARALAFSACMLTGLLSMGLYRPRQRPTDAEAAARVILGVSVGVIMNVLLFFILPALTLGRGVMLIAALASGIAMIAVRLVVLRLLDINPIKRRVLVIGAGETAAKISMLRRRADRRRFDATAYVAVSEAERQQAARLGIEPVITAAEARLGRRPDEIVVALDDRRGVLPLDFLLAQKQAGVPVTDIMDFLERETERLDLDILRPSWLLYENCSQTDLVYRWLKRTFDVLFAMGLLLLTWPVLMLAAFAIRAEEGIRAPILYRQDRVGRNGRVFQLLKFRSMRRDAERHTGPQFASKNDHRVTRVGRVMRRFRIDELPQLLNIIRGDMSVVGPRPERPEFVNTLSGRIPLYFYRHGVRPGLTGWAQLNFPYGGRMEDAREKLEYDLYYIKNTTIVLDLLILLQTLEVVAWGRGMSMSGTAPALAPAPAVQRDTTQPDQQSLLLDEPRSQDAA